MTIYTDWLYNLYRTSNNYRNKKYILILKFVKSDC